MKSGRQKRAEIDALRSIRIEEERRQALLEAEQLRSKAFAEAMRRGELTVNPAILAPNNSYGEAEFVRRGTYLPVPFTCKICGKQEVWTPHQQKWWYEIAKGDRFSTALMCRPCRANARRRKAVARRVHLEGLERKRR